MSNQPSRTALVIAHEPDGPAGMVGERLEQRGFKLHTHVVTDDYDKPNNAAPFPDHAAYDLLVVMGSVRSLTRKHEIDSWIQSELDMCVEAHHRGQPILGICFGGQVLAEALGGKVESAPKGEFGWHAIQPGEEFGHLDWSTGPWMQWHHDRFQPPDEADVLAVSDEGVQLFRLDRTIGTQFHPEVDHHHLAEWLGTADDDYLDSVGMDRKAILTETMDRQDAARVRCHAFVDWFLEQVDLDGSVG